MNRKQYALTIIWSDTAAPDLPTLVGPFYARSEAEKWGRLNVPNGSYLVAHLAQPYADRFEDPR
ncbi:hypothetical protein [Luteipulveratus mongoliensis]|uniref:Uncharacterized protein n=1 Tax=Luteipulveratus mongoliensis TaxID=571913 RepID=A0A0K1JGQ0_9MICO|nr:hypothetical protein [Luteipulveratus mongoliensis]AKU15760.1 hypothetical protein VV02_07680 [Luteipulveratus mongoliensis]